MIPRTVATFLLACALSLAANAQTRLTITAEAGAGDYIRAGAQTPVRVTLQNGVQPYQGRVAVSFLSRDKVLSTAIREVELATAAAKRVTLYLPAAAMATTLRVSYQTFRGPLGWRDLTRIEQNLTQIDSESPVFAGITTVPRGLPPERDEKNRRAYYRLFLQPNQLPDRHEGLEMFDVLFLTPPVAQQYTGPQIRALDEWVLRGGMLIVDASSPADAYRPGRLGDFMSFIPQSSEQDTLPLFDRDVLYATGAKPTGEILLESGGIPLVSRNNHGLGSVVTFAIAPDDPALQNWDRFPDLWSKILGQLLIPHDAFAVTDFSGNYIGKKFASIADALAQRVTEAPSTGMRLGLVLLMTGIYALVAGPGDYLLVRKLKRPRLTWITFPCIVAIFTLAAYLGARYWIGGDWEIRNVQRTVVFPEQATALQLDLTGVFVPQGAEYQIESESPAMLRHIGDLYGLEDRTQIDGDNQTIEQTIPIWTHRAYITSETLDNHTPIEAQWTWDVEQVHVDLTNNTDGALDPQYLMAEDGVWALRRQGRPIAPGETTRISVRRDQVNMMSREEMEAASLHGSNSELRAPQVPSKWKAYDKPSFILYGLAAGPPGRSPFARELNLRAAIDRGAQVISLTAQNAANPIKIDGRSFNPASANTVYQVVSYDRAYTQTATP